MLLAVKVFFAEHNLREYSVSGRHSFCIVNILFVREQMLDKESALVVVIDFIKLCNAAHIVRIVAGIVHNVKFADASSASGYTGIVLLHLANVLIKTVTVVIKRSNRFFKVGTFPY